MTAAATQATTETPPDPAGVAAVAIRLVLRRIDLNSYASYGHFADAEDRQICVSLELPWLNNHPQTSCIPAAVYVCKRRWSKRHNCEVFEITGVPDRSDIEIHPANWPSQLLGCVAPGTAFGMIEGKHGVSASDAAFDKLMAMLAGVDEFVLDVRNPAPVSSHV